jgi:hypothetical protein
MTLIARPATAGPWIDFSTFPTLAQLQSFRLRGIIGCLCYVPLPGVSEAQKAHDITAARLSMLTEELGFEVAIVQHCRFPGWACEAHSGRTDAEAAVAHARLVGYPAEAHIYEDWEGVSPSSSAASAKIFLQDWAFTVLGANSSDPASYRAALYVGYQQPLSSQELYLLHGINSYGSDAGHRKVDVRGVAFSQGPQMTIDGALVDPDVVAPDLLDQLPWVAAAAPSEAA